MMLYRVGNDVVCVRHGEGCRQRVEMVPGRGSKFEVEGCGLDYYKGVGFRVWGQEFGVESVGFTVEGLGSKIQGLGFRVQGFG